MKKIVLKTTFVITIIGIGILSSTNSAKGISRLSDLTLSNIEALAGDEEVPNKRICYGQGALDCWDGSKAEYIVNVWSLDLE